MESTARPQCTPQERSTPNETHRTSEQARSPCAPLFAAGDGVAARGRQPAARQGLHSSHAAGRPWGGPLGACGVAAHFVAPAIRLRRALPSSHLLNRPLPLGRLVPFGDEPRLLLCCPASKWVLAARPFWLPARRDDAMWQAALKEEQRGRGPKGPRTITHTCGTAHFGHRGLV